MPGTYNREERLITLHTEMLQEPELTTASLIHFIVDDLLHENNFSMIGYPELIDITVIGTGLGILQSNIDLVATTGLFWDLSVWNAAKSFLDEPSKAYVNAIAAWVRNEKSPDWADDLPKDTKRPFQKSLKYLFKTDDSFFRVSENRQSSLKQPQNDWLKLANSGSASDMIIALRHLEFDNQQNSQLNSQTEPLLLENLRSNDATLLLHSIAAVDRMETISTAVAEELRQLAVYPQDEVRAKAVCSLARHRQLDDPTIGVAAKMLESKVRFIVFAGVLGLTSVESIPDHAIEPANRGFLRALQNCDSEFINLFAAAFDRWVPDPEKHFTDLLQEDSPEYLEMAREALQTLHDNLVTLDSE